MDTPIPPSNVTPEEALPSELTDVEFRAIKARRTAVNLEEPQAGDPNYIGLALSGGGVRSAAFNLGVLQALLKNKVMRHIDFLSSVSGGGYIAGFLDSQAQSCIEEKKTSPENDACRCYSEVEKAICPHSNGAPTQQIQHLYNRCAYLNDPWAFLNRYLSGLFLTHVVLLSTVLVCAIALAMLWRCLDLPGIVDFLLWLSNGYILEWNRPFLPAAFLVAFWLAIWLVLVLFGKENWKAARRSGMLLVLAMIASLVGLATWLATPNMNWMNVLAENRGTTSNELTSWPSHLAYVILLIVAVLLLPFIRPRALLQSGARVDSPWRQWVFWMAGMSLAIGVPFTTVWFFARHGISTQATSWHRQLVREDIRDWPGFVTRAGTSKELANALDVDKATEKLTQDEIDNLSKAKVWHCSLSGKDTMNFVAQLNEPRGFWSHQPWSGENGYWAQELKKFKYMNELNTLIKKKEIVKHLLRYFGSIAKFTDNIQNWRVSPDKYWSDEARRLSTFLEYPDLVRNETDSQTAGHLLLRALFPEDFLPVKLVSRPLVIEQDQSCRFLILVICTSVFILSGLLINLNWTSMHGFYRTQIEHAFTAVPQADSAHSLPLSSLKHVEVGFPYHLLTGTVEVPEQPDVTEGFLFSPCYCGSNSLGYFPTIDYRGGHFPLSSAIAISGAAVAPLRFQNLLLRIVLAVTNARVGQWLPNPGQNSSPRYPTYVPLFRLPFYRMFETRQRDYFVFVADGGFHDNLGIEPLIDRRCRLIFASDAGADPKYRFEDLARVYRRCEAKGVQFLEIDSNSPLNINRLLPKNTTKCETDQEESYIIGRIKYPDEEEELSRPPAILIYIKSLLRGNLPFVLWQYARVNTDFPNDPILNQFFTPVQFDSYRHLGYLLTCRLCEHLKLNEGYKTNEHLLESIVQVIGAQIQSPEVEKLRSRTRQNTAKMC